MRQAASESAEAKASPDATAVPSGEATRPWWMLGPDAALVQLGSTAQGLAQAEAAARCARVGPNLIAPPRRTLLVLEFLRRFGNPLILLLVAASAVALYTGDAHSAAIIQIMIFAGVLLDFVQEHRAQRALDRLRQSVIVHASVLRDGQPREVPIPELVPGDVLLLRAGDLVPADGLILESRNLYVNQSVLTGEAFPVEKGAGRPPRDVSLASAANALFMGAAVVSGSARVLVMATGARAELGRVADMLRSPPEITPLERGTHQFGLLILRLTVLMSMGVVLVNAHLGRPLLESFMFAVALAVGLAPELMPMIVSVTLARGALRLARAHVVVKRPSAVYALGSIDVLCTDKTGTLSEGVVQLVAHIDANGQDSPRALELAYLNSVFESGLRSPLDDAVISHCDASMQARAAAWKKIDELPFDFERRRVSVLVQAPAGRRVVIVKGAPEAILSCCTTVQFEDETAVPFDAARRSAVIERFNAFSAEGLRVLALACRDADTADRLVVEREEDALAFVGLLAFVDPPRPDAARILSALQRDGIAIKILSGDHESVTLHLCNEVNLPVRGVVVGTALDAMDDAALGAAAQQANLFCRVTPAQKQRILRVLRERGHTVGFMGDGVNDAPALRLADVGISVDQAVDVARDAADVVLLRHDLTVLHAGVREGRRTYANIMKYLMMVTSSSFGNMTSMAAASLFLPFLPLLPVQVLLNNLLYDISEVPIPLDRVDAAELRKPHPWDMRFIRDFMLVFGPLSSLFDFITFYVLLAGFGFQAAAFRTAWFVESIATQVLVIFIIRTRRSAWASQPHPALALTSLGVVLVAALLPYTAFGALFALVPLPAGYFAVLALIALAYLALAESTKHWFYRRVANRRRAVLRA